MLLLTLLLAFATVIFCSPLHSGQTVNEAAELARRVVKDAGTYTSIIGSIILVGCFAYIRLQGLVPF